MSEVGDRDEFGQFCIDGVEVRKDGPTTQNQIAQVVREAIMKGGGDKWSTLDFYSAYPETNSRKTRTYRQIDYPILGRFRIIPTNGCEFHHIRNGYGGVAYGRDYVPELTPHEKAASWNLNVGMRHHVGKSSRNQGYGLKCDDAGWVDLDEVLKYSFFWAHPNIQEPVLLWTRNNGEGAMDLNEASRRMRSLFKIMYHSVVDGKSVPRCWHLWQHKRHIPPEGLHTNLPQEW